MRGAGSPSAGAAYLAAAAQAVIIGFSFLFVKTALVEAGAMDVLAHRITVGFITALVALLAARVKVRIGLRDLARLLPAAVCFPILVYLFQTYSLRTLPSAEGGIIQALVPIFTVVLAAFFLREKSTGLQVAFICLSVFGVIFMLVMKGISLEAFDALGTMLMVLSVLAGAANSIVVRRLTKRYPWYVISLYALGLGALFYNILSLGGHLAAGTLVQYVAPFAQPGYVLSILYLGAGSAFAASILCNFALSRIESSRMTVFNNLSMVVTVAAGALFLGERVYWYHIVGAAVIIAGIYGTNRFRGRQPAPSAR